MDPDSQVQAMIIPQNSCRPPRLRCGTIFNLTAKAIISAIAVMISHHAYARSSEYPSQGIFSRGAGAGQDDSTLEPGKSIERQLPGGAVHSYRLNLDAGRFLRIIVEANDTDVVVALYRPTGEKIVEVDTDEGPRSGEQVFFIGEWTGDYSLRVRSSDSAAKPGSYVLKVAESRPATAQDYGRIEAQRLLLEGVRSLQQGTINSRRDAAEKLRLSLERWRSMNEPLATAVTLSRFGQVSYYLGNSQYALQCFIEELELREALGHKGNLAVALNNVGFIYESLGNRRRALEYYGRSLKIKREIEDRKGEAATLNNIGMIYHSQGDPQEALKYFDQLLPIRREVGDRKGEALTLGNIALVYDSIGDTQKAFEYYHRSLMIRQDIGDHAGEAVALGNIGAVYSMLGDDRQALKYYDEALTIHRNAGDLRNEAVTLNNIACVYDSLPDRQRASVPLNRALQIFREIKDRRGEGIALNNIGRHYEGEGDNTKALEYYNQALTIEREIGGRNSEARTLSNISRIYESSGDKNGALITCNDALRIFRDVRDRRAEAIILARLARIEGAIGNVTQGTSHIENAISIAESLRAKITGQDLRSSFFVSAHEYYEIYIELLMRLHRLHPTEEFDRKALEASERGRARSLLETLTEARADIRHGADADLVEKERSLLQLLAAKYERLIRLNPNKAAGQQAQEATTEIDELSARLQQVQAEIRSKSPRYAALTQPQPLGAREIQQQIVDDDTLLLEYALGDERSFLWAVSPTSIASFELPKRSVIDEAAQRVYELLTARLRQEGQETRAQKKARIARAAAAYPAAATALSQMLLGPVAARLGNKRLVIVSEGSLQYISFAALPRPVMSNAPHTRSRTANGPPLVVEHEIVNLPSASVLAVLRRELAGRPSAPKAAAVLADPVFEATDLRVRNTAALQDGLAGAESNSQASLSVSQLQMARSLDETEVKEGQRIPRLPYSQREADAIRSLVPEVSRKLAVGFEANHVTATDPEMADYRIVHFATHSLLNSKQPELSGILLSLVDEQGRPLERGILSLTEVYNLNLTADLVVLSACRTALGKDVKGEGLIGLTRGFMYAGAARVVASLWKADDEATAELMKLLYGGMLGSQHLRPADALRHAQIRMWRSKSDWSAPYYWAAFTIQGEWK